MKEECGKCGGTGYYLGHDKLENHEDRGYPHCVTCPVQVECEECDTTGQVEINKTN